MFNLYMILNFLSLVILLIMVLVGVAFLTLLERKILGYIQDRKGPNKVGVVGIFQPFSDAIKLFSKEVFIMFKSNYVLYYISPVFSILSMLMLWMIFPVITNIYYVNYSILGVVVLISVGGYIMLFMGWSSNSVYSMMGSLRSVAQSLSYEVSFILILMILMIMSESYSFVDFINWQCYLWYMVTLFPVFIMFFISSLAELNRTPMDFIEGESELVSGFNVEYFSGGFALIFISEYGMIIYFGLLMSLMFTNLLTNLLLMMFFNSLFVLLIIFMRGVLPRMRYDELMYLCWKVILPLVLLYMLLIVGLKVSVSLFI